MLVQTRKITANPLVVRITDCHGLTDYPDPKIRAIRFICLIRDSDNFRRLHNPNPSIFGRFLSYPVYPSILKILIQHYTHAAPLGLCWFIKLIDSIH